MFPTVEVRWFYAGAIPSKVLKWFQQGEGEPEEQPDRVDHYLNLAGRDYVGIKLREGRLEIKQRHRQYDVVRFHKRVAGRLEGWHKWSFQLAEANNGLASIIASTSWIGVKKTRKLRRYRVTDDKKVTTVSVAEYPNQGCDWELTNIRAGGGGWWSISFEAFGEESALRENLLFVAKYIFGEGEPPTLAVQNSWSYPKWLGILQQRDRVL